MSESTHSPIDDLDVLLEAGMAKPHVHQIYGCESRDLILLRPNIFGGINYFFFKCCGFRMMRMIKIHQEKCNGCGEWVNERVRKVRYCPTCGKMEQRYSNGYWETFVPKRETK